MRRVDARRVKIHRSYTIEEVVRCLGVHKHTVRRWLKAGLPAIDARRPTLIHGAALRSYLEDSRRARRQPCGQGELFCFRCRHPRAPAGGILDYLPISSISGIRSRMNAVSIFSSASRCWLPYRGAWAG